MVNRVISRSGLMVALLLSACASPRFEGRPDLTVFDNKPLPEPVRKDLIIPSRPYVIGPSDQLSIDVFGIDELSKNVTVDLTGQIALPLIGSLKVSGMTTDEADRRARGQVSLGACPQSPGNGEHRDGRQPGDHGRWLRHDARHLSAPRPNVIDAGNRARIRHI